MAKIFITGSTDGLGFLAAQMLINEGHNVVLHARNEERSKELQEKLTSSQTILTANLSDIKATKELAKELNRLGAFDAIIHNAGVYESSNEEIFKVNVLAPYILSALVHKPKRLIYIGSNMHQQGVLDIENISLEQGVNYATSKLLVLMLSFTLARKWPDVYVNTVDPGWVPTKMGGSSAPDDLDEGAKTQVWLASSEAATFSGLYLFHMQEASHSLKADNISAQEQLLQHYKMISGVELQD
ncbi:SDR family NAD(P)-dependent oxidoreductase [Sulfurimonas sp. C5]|uniref:SDR family NAD(P)-dependent oxidoreductase n=1 Tax=Sulfurimonas sp. C5 TaxID=3036947 RepID=UPI002456A535|nr:SDR family NAD(P)-dependent oxidoreductase [Sulfurimonas sp. C5]MDH4944151.1 SDR family NAD(P)-dependent oxidoreductase [Sulfurimonas sp. C5]